MLLPVTSCEKLDQSQTSCDTAGTKYLLSCLKWEKFILVHCNFSWLAPWQKHHGSSAGWRKTAHLMGARKERHRKSQKGRGSGPGIDAKVLSPFPTQIHPEICLVIMVESLKLIKLAIKIDHHSFLHVWSNSRWGCHMPFLPQQFTPCFHCLIVFFCYFKVIHDFSAFLYYSSWSSSPVIWACRSFITAAFSSLYCTCIWDDVASL